MKLVIVALAFLATAYAALPSNDYLPPLEEASNDSNGSLQTLSESSPLADDGYRYRTVRRYRFRHRRDVSELPSSDYLPPAQASPVADVPVPAEAPVQVTQAQDAAILADDGYRYRTIKRYRLRHRRDVSELPLNDYLPPSQDVHVETAPAPALAPAPGPMVAPVPAAVEAQESAVLADDGYRYRAVKRYRLRHRRDVSELPSNDYLPPSQESHVEIAPAPAITPAPAVAQESAVLADDGYRYKTVRRVVYKRV